MSKLNKAFLFLTITTVMMIITTVAMSATVEVGDNGALHAAEHICGKKAPINTVDIFFHDGLFHLKKSLRIHTGVVCDNTGVHLVHNVSLESKTVLNWYVIFLVISLILLIPEIYFVRRGKKKGEADNEIPKIISILITFVLAILAFSAFAGFYDGFVITTNFWIMFISAMSVTLAMFLMGICLLTAVTDTNGVCEDAEDFRSVIGIYVILAIFSLGFFFIN